MPTLNPKTLHHSLRTSAWLSLFTSSSTLLCCALPAMLVALGAGATLSSLVTAVPQLVWLSEHKVPLFIIATLMLTLASVLQWRARGAPCPIDPQLARACARTRRVSLWVTGFSWLMLAVGAWFAFIAPWLMAS